MTISNVANQIKKGSEADALKFIFDYAFRSGFGMLSKTELDLILFSAVLKFADQKNTSDHDLSKYLQITQQRVRSLRSRASVKYLVMEPVEAIQKFIEQIAYAKVDGNYLDIPIPDIAVRNEIEAILDSSNLLLHTQRNPKIFRVRVDDFLEFSIQLEVLLSGGKKSEAKLEESILKELKKKAKKSEKIMKILTAEEADQNEWTKETIKKAMLKGGFAFGIDMLASLIPGGTLFTGPAKQLLESIRDKV